MWTPGAPPDTRWPAPAFDPISAIVGVGAIGSLAGSVMSSGAASGAAETQAAAANRAADITHQQYLQTRQDLLPFSSQGAAAFNQLGRIFGLPQGGGQPQGQPAQNPLASAVSQPQPQGGSLPQGWSIAPMYDPGGENTPAREGQLVIDAQGNVMGGPFPTNMTQQQIIAQLGFAGAPQQTAPGFATPYGPAPPTGPDQSVLNSYGLSGLTYDPASYGLGTGVFDPASVGLGDGTFKPTQAFLEQTPGYQFIRDQGLKSVQNSATAKGQGISGAAMKGAADFATGLASNTYGQQADIFNKNLANALGIYQGNLSNTQGIFQQNLGNVINPLFQYSQLGANAASQTGNIGANLVNTQGNLLAGGANALAAGQVGSANAISSGLNNLGSAGTNYLLMRKLLSSA